MDDKQKVTILLSILGILLIGIGLEVMFMNGDFNKNETKEPNKVVDDNNKSENKEEDNNKDDKLVYIDTNIDISSKMVNNIVGGLKIDTEYISDTGDWFSIRLLGTGQYEENDDLYTYYGTYSINNEILTLNRKYVQGSDCTIEEAKGTKQYKIKDNTIVIDEKTILKEGEKYIFSIPNDVCEYKKGKYKYKSDFKYESETEEVRIIFLPYKYYLMTYCKDKKCGTSFGTYSDNNSKITLNQTIFLAQDACYYNQNKTFKGIAVKGSKKFKEPRVLEYEKITIDLTGSQDVTMGEYELVSTIEDYDSLLDVVRPMFKSYCGKL